MGNPPVRKKKDIIDRQDLIGELDALAADKGASASRPAVLACLKAALKTG